MPAPAGIVPVAAAAQVGRTVGGRPVPAR